MEQEIIWAPIPGYEGLYEVSTVGQVKSLNYRGTKIEQLLAPSKTKPWGNGNYYHAYSLCKKGDKTRYMLAHMLVAMAFLGHVPKGLSVVVCHKNGIGWDNRLENLEVATARHNMSQERTEKSGLPRGVDVVKRTGKFRARLNVGNQHNRKTYYLGSFDTPEEASEAYEAKLKEIENILPSAVS